MRDSARGTANHHTRACVGRLTEVDTPSWGPVVCVHSRFAYDGMEGEALQLTAVKLKLDLHPSRTNDVLAGVRQQLDLMVMRCGRPLIPPRASAEGLDGDDSDTACDTHTRPWTHGVAVRSAA